MPVNFASSPKLTQNRRTQYNHSKCRIFLVSFHRAHYNVFIIFFFASHLKRRKRNSNPSVDQELSFELFRTLIKLKDFEMKARKFTLFPIIRQFVCFSCDNTQTCACGKRKTNATTKHCQIVLFWRDQRSMAVHIFRRRYQVEHISTV